MSVQTRWKFALAFLAIVLATSTAAADTAVATKWKPLGEAQNDCMAHAQMAIWRSGFDKSAPGSESMAGKKGDYTVSIRCVATARIVFFVASGPSPDATAQYLEVLFGHF
jgi:hypothetical protein